MSAKSPEVVDSMIDDSLLGILVILLVVMLSTGYVYIQQLRQGDIPLAGAAAANLARMAPSTAAALSLSSKRTAISTTGLNDRQARLHFTLPIRNGARCITVSGDALVKTENPESLAWTDDEVPHLLADLSYVADLHLLFVVKDAGDTASMQRIRDFVATHPELKSSNSTLGGVKAHKILFCTTAIGKIAFVRQIEPQIHVEVDAGIARDLERHVPRIVHIPKSSQDTATSTMPNVIHVADTFTSYFLLISAKV
ncbi:hypothetical protein CCR75_003936 [Bremia lactucae]|uniref:Peroxisome biogenesis protein 22 n=1 Tax=Bremia lactucae TaxID=4779 RepID=A0A976FMV3_BRELC|nr:hypothetical protein CCR75_003936 [Bremia lactucae]